jgi:hypothetical protein
MRRLILAVGGIGLVLGCLVAGGCQNVSAADVVVNSDTPAASLRQGLDFLLQEHMILVCSATDAALAGRDDQFTAANNVMDDNTRELAGAFGHIYGEAVGRSFYDLWHKHDGLIVDYTLAVAMHKPDDADKAVTGQIAFAREFGTFMETTTGGRLRRDNVADQMRTEAAFINSVVEAQAAKDYARAFVRERDLEKAIVGIGNNWITTIVQQFPNQY